MVLFVYMLLFVPPSFHPDKTGQIRFYCRKYGNRSELADIDTQYQFRHMQFLYYRPQRSWGKVMFLHVSVILFTGEGSRHPPQDQAPPPAQTPLPCAVHARRYGQRAGGMHPTGMHSCYYFLYLNPCEIQNKVLLWIQFGPCSVYDRDVIKFWQLVAHLGQWQLKVGQLNVA